MPRGRGQVCSKGWVCPGGGYVWECMFREGVCMSRGWVSTLPPEGIWDQGKPPPPPGGRDLGPGMPLDRQTCENITFPQLRWRVVNFFSLVSGAFSVQSITQNTLLQSFEGVASPQDPLIKHWIVMCVRVRVCMCVCVCVCV